MLKKLLLTTLFCSVAFGYEIVVDETVKELGFKLEKKSTLSRDDAKEVVVDSATGLMWQDDRRASSVKKSWEDAKRYCQNLSHAGYSDWYLPSIKELETLADTSKNDPAIKKGFVNVVSSYYWSSSSDVSDSKDAWNVYFEDGDSYYYDRKASDFYVRCARAGQ